MGGAEKRQLPYLFKLKQQANVKKLIGKVFGRSEWEEAGQHWQGLTTELRLSGWSKARRVVVLRRPRRHGARQYGVEDRRKRRHALERPVGSA